MDSERRSNYNGYQLETGIGPTVDKILNTIIEKLNSQKFKQNLTEKVIDPVTGMIHKKMRPYYYGATVAYLIVIILLVVIIYLLVKKRK